ARAGLRYRRRSPTGSAMEPIAASGSASVLRSSGNPADASAALRQGRVLSAEVLAAGTDGTLLLAIGRHAIPAQTDLRLDPGARFLVRVLEEAGGIVLEKLAGEDVEESALVRTLRTVLADARPL